MEAPLYNKTATAPQIDFPVTFSNEIYVAPLPFDITERDLRHLFSLCGTVLDVRVSNRKNPYFAFAHVEFQKAESMKKAIRFYHGKFLGYNSLIVQEAIKKRQIDFKEAKYENTEDKETVYGDDSRDQDSRPKKKIHIDDFDISLKRKFKCFGNADPYYPKEKVASIQRPSENQKKDQIKLENGSEKIEETNQNTQSKKELSIEY